MKPSPQSRVVYRATAFSLVEMAAVLAILGTLMTAGISLLGGTGAQSRRAGADLLTGLIEQARTTAITSRSHVVLAIAEPGDSASGDERCRLGLFKIREWPDSRKSPLILTGVLLKRWQSLDAGIVLTGGDLSGLPNPLDGEKVTIGDRSTGNPGLKVHLLAFNPQGGLHHPPGSSSVVIRISEGHYRGGKAVSTSRAGSESRLKIGRVTARPYCTDG